MSQTTRKEVLERLRRRYRKAGREHKRKLLDQAEELFSRQPIRIALVIREPLVPNRPPGNFKYLGLKGTLEAAAGWE